jgi:hypothetical protein
VIETVVVLIPDAGTMPVTVGDAAAAGTTINTRVSITIRIA